MSDQIDHRPHWLALLATALLAAATPAHAQTGAPTTYDRAIAAGYKALTLCSAMFIGGRTQAQVEAEELNGIYPEYDAIVPTLTDVKITHTPARSSVNVSFAETLPPRSAIWVSKERGCELRPIGFDTDEVGLVVAAIDPYMPYRNVRSPLIELSNGAPVLRLSLKASKVLEPVAAKAFDPANYGPGSHTTGIVIVRDGTIVAEHYAQGFGEDTAQRTWSVAKSISGTLVGIAVRQGLLDVKRPARIPEWNLAADPRRSITLDNLLRMASGLHSDTAGNRTDAIYFGGTAVTEKATGWPLEAPPGSRFRYANNDILLAIRSLRAALNTDARYWAFPKAELFDRIGMTHTIPETDWRGNFILSSQVWSTARDLARLGLLWLNDGVWAGERILPEGWVKYMTTPSGPQPAKGPGYGATLWLFGPEQGLPAGSYAAQGNRGQYVMVVPSKRLVIVRRGEDPAGHGFDIARFTADVIGAVE